MSLPASITSLVTAMETTTTRIATSATSGKVFLKMTKQGFWAFGADEVEVEEGSQWAINPNAFATGYACWGDGTLIDEAMSLITEEPIVKGSLEVHPKPWNEQIGLQLACTSGSDKGVEAIYTATSKGGKDAFAALLNEVLERAKKGKMDIVPVVELDVSSYKHKKFGKVFTPIFHVVEWAEIGATTVPDAAAETAADPEPVAEPEPAPEKPRRRRRAAA